MTFALLAGRTASRASVSRIIAEREGPGDDLDWPFALVLHRSFFTWRTFEGRENPGDRGLLSRDQPGWQGRARTRRRLGMGDGPFEPEAPTSPAGHTNLRLPRPLPGFLRRAHDVMLT